MEKREEGRKRWGKHRPKKRRTKILIASCGWARTCVCVCARACQCRLGHPTLFNVTLTSKPCVPALNADRMERVFIWLWLSPSEWTGPSINSDLTAALLIHSPATANAEIIVQDLWTGGVCAWAGVTVFKSWNMKIKTGCAHARSSLQGFRDSGVMLAALHSDV